jgi:hypothetical protein
MMWLPHQQLNNFFNMSALKINLTKPRHKQLLCSLISSKPTSTVLNSSDRQNPLPIQVRVKAMALTHL